MHTVCGVRHEGVSGHRGGAGCVRGAEGCGHEGGFGREVGFGREGASTDAASDHDRLYVAALRLHASWTQVHAWPTASTVLMTNKRTSAPPFGNHIKDSNLYAHIAAINSSSAHVVVGGVGITVVNELNESVSIEI